MHGRTLVNRPRGLLSTGQILKIVKSGIAPYVRANFIFRIRWALGLDRARILGRLPNRGCGGIVPGLGMLWTNTTIVPGHEYNMGEVSAVVLFRQL